MVKYMCRTPLKGQGIIRKSSPMLVNHSRMNQQISFRYWVECIENGKTISKHSLGGWPKKCDKNSPKFTSVWRQWPVMERSRRHSWANAQRQGTAAENKRLAYHNCHRSSRWLWWCPNYHPMQTQEGVRDQNLRAYSQQCHSGSQRCHAISPKSWSREGLSVSMGILGQLVAKCVKVLSKWPQNLYVLDSIIPAAALLSWVAIQQRLSLESKDDYHCSVLSCNS